MKRKSNYKILAFLLAIVFLFSCVSTSVAATVPSNDTVDQIVEGNVAGSGSAVGLRDHSIPTDQKHAYDPFAQMETEEATEAYRRSAKYEAGTIIFKLSTTDTFILGEDRETEDEALSALGIDPSSMVELSKRRVDDGLFRDDYEIIYQADLTGDVWSAVDALAETEGVLAAQPNYLYEDTAVGVPTVAKNPHKDKQWQHGPDHLDCDKHWQHMYDEDITPGEGSIVAVIDTGVDYTHPDLAANMWVNVAELNGVAGVDDDGNGYIDDIHGASTVGATYYHSGDPMDDYGHGTHVAGIIAMTANNDEGAVGLAYGAKIMAIKAGQATGIFSDTDIAEAINYAVANGADVINMSFGGTGRSFLVEEALSDAFATCVLVASAGNDSLPTSDAPADFIKKADFYPAGYSYVLGVMASDADGNLASFSNWDYYNNGGSAEYEMTAPGVDIFSTVPGGEYASWDGTSMAAPLVSAAAAMIRSKYSDKNTYSSRFIMGQLASATDKTLTYEDKLHVPHTYTMLDLEASLNELPEPNVTVKNTYLFDSPSIDPANDGDGIVDAGETIDLGLVLRNQWGLADNVTVTVTSTSSNGIQNPNIEWITDTVEMEPIGTFNEQNNSFVYENDALVGTANPLRFKVKENTINDAHICLNITVTAKNGLDSEDTNTYTEASTLYFFVQRGRTLSGTIQEDMTLTADDYWIIENSVYIPQGVTVTVEPGTQMQFWGSDASDPYAASTMAYIEVDGTFLVQGNEEAPVEMFPSVAFSYYGVDIRGGVDCNYAAHPESKTVGRTELSYANIINPRLNYNRGDHLYAVQNNRDVSYRYLDAGSVRESYSGAILVCNSTSDSEFVNFYAASIGGSFFRTLFQGCDACNINYAADLSFAAEACVFTGSNSWTGAGFRLKNPQVMVFMPSATVSRVHEYGGHKYVSVSWAGDPFFDIFRAQNGTSFFSDYEGTARYFMMNALAEGRGGHLAVPNTEEEESYLRQMVATLNEFTTFGVYAFPGETSVSVNGEPSVISYSNNNSEPLFGWSNGNSLWLNSSVCSSVIYEFPAAISDDTIRKAFTQEEYVAAFLAEKDWLSVPEERCTNNAFLNSFYQTDTSKWNTLQTDYDRSCVMLARNNYWGTDNEKLIQAQIIDADTYAGLADIVTTPYLTLESPELETIYPFVTEAYITDTEGNRIDSCGNQEIQLHVKFNRDMDQTVDPMVSYGPAEPYTDYLVDGEWVSAREWVGTTKVTSVIDAGTEYIRVKNAVADDDGWLKTGTDEARFAFEIERTGAQALTLQAEGGENKISLNWSQDDYATLAGYNVYRATSADGTFTKINERMIPGTIRQFVDTDVEPGKEYFYYFTVLTTSLTESDPSNIASATAIDNVKPSLTHTVITQANFGQPISFAATATDNIAVSYVWVFYRAKGAEDWKVLEMSNTDGDNYYGVISATEVSADGMEYYMETSDGTSIDRYGSDIYPLRIAVDFSLTIFSVSVNKVDVNSVADGITAVLSGANFTEGMTLKVGSRVVEYELVSSNQLSFRIPQGNVGKADIVLTDGTRSARLTNAITYGDAKAYAQIVAPGEAKSGDRVRLPIVLSVNGNVDAVDLQLKLDKSLYSKVSFEKAEGIAMASCNTSYNGVVKISAIATEPLDLSKPIGYLVLDVNRITEAQLTSIQITSAIANTVSVDSLMGCKLEVKPNFTVSGKITYYNSDEGIAGVTVRLNNGMTAVTDENGIYTFVGITTNAIVITPEFHGSVNGAISAQDAALVLQSITGEGEALDGLFFVAADVDGDGYLTASDASAILKKSIGAIEGDFDGSGREWTFDQSAKVLTLTDNVSNANFEGILLGDVSGNWTSVPMDSME